MYQVTLEEAAEQLSELVRDLHEGQEVILLRGQTPVARLLPINSTAEVSSAEIAALAQAGGAFDWLAEEPDLYDMTSGVSIDHRNQESANQMGYAVLTLNCSR